MNASNNGSKWCLRPRPVKTPACRLLCFPHAGGASSFFRHWPEGLPGDVEAVAIQLPGRAGRFRERPYTEMDKLLPALADGILSLLDRPFAFFGFSFGAFVSFELARLLQRKKGRQPFHLFVAAQRGPHLPDRSPPLRHLADDLFVDAIHCKYGGIADELRQNPEFMSVFVNSLRADLTMNETYVYRQHQPLKCPITAFGGIQDDAVKEHDLSSWRDQTLNTFDLELFPGDHFFPEQNREALLNSVSERLCLPNRQMMP